MSLGVTQNQVIFCYLGIIDGKRMYYALTTSGIIMVSTTL